MTRVAGACAACGSQSLFLGAGGHVTCGRSDCPDPGLMDTVLHDGRPHHLVRLTEHDFSILHPLSERARLGLSLAECPLHRELNGLSGPPLKPGEYEVREAEDRWHWGRLP